jgi:hypothetical protein
MAKKNIANLVLLFISAFTISTSAQNTNNNSTHKKENLYFDAFIGTQVSGIRSEDYVTSNFAPYFQVSVGKILSDKFSVNINFQGPYFNFIGDDYKHNYQFLGSDLLLDLFKAFNKSYCGNWNLYLFAGPGLLFNNYINKTNFCISGGLITEYRYKTIGFKFKVSAIAGFKIYQHDRDALTNTSIGISKYF